MKRGKKKKTIEGKHHKYLGSPGESSNTKTRRNKDRYTLFEQASGATSGERRKLQKERKGIGGLRRM